MRVLAVALTAVLILLSVAGLVGFVVAGPIAQALVGAVPAEPEAAGPGDDPGRRWRDAAVSALWIAGILCVFPQGLQLVVAAGFIVVGLAAIWWAETIRRRPAQPQA